MSTAKKLEVSADFIDVPLAQIHASKLNPRKTFSQAKLDELAASLASKGQQSPILLRPNSDGYEIVYGERRWRAAEIAGLSSLTARIRDLSDQEALEEALTENGARADVDEYEEAEAFRQLRDQHGRSAEEIAARIGKSLGTVYERLKLAGLDAKAREAAQAADLAPSTAAYAARIHGADRQLKAIEQIVKEGFSFREARDYIQREFMLRLADAPFSVKDADLVPEAGPCTTCPKRTGAQRELFADVAKKDDLCLDSKCHTGKVDAHWEQRRAEAEAKGLKVLDDKKAKEVLRYANYPSGGYVDATDTGFDGGAEKSYESLAKKAGIEPIIARDPVTGAERKLFKREEIDEKIQSTRKESAEDKKWKAEQERERKKREADAAKKRQLRKDAVARAEQADLSIAAFRGALILLASGDYDATCEMRGWRDEKNKDADAEKIVFSKVTAMPWPELRGFFVDLAFDVAQGNYAEGDDALELLYAGLGLGKPAPGAKATKKPAAPKKPKATKAAKASKKKR